MKRKPCLDWNGKRGEYVCHLGLLKAYAEKLPEGWDATVVKPGASIRDYYILCTHKHKSREDAMLACEDAIRDYLQPMAELYQKLKENA